MPLSCCSSDVDAASTSLVRWRHGGASGALGVGFGVEGLDHGQVEEAAAEQAERVVAFGHAQADLKAWERGPDPGPGAGRGG